MCGCASDDYEKPVSGSVVGNVFRGAGDDAACAIICKSERCGGAGRGRGGH